MSKIMKMGWVLWMVGVATVMSTPCFAKSFSVKDAGISLWIFVIIGGIIILLQLVPATILFISFIGTTSALVLKSKKSEEKETVEGEDQVSLPGYKTIHVEE